MSVDNFDSLHFQRINSYVEIEYRDRLATRTVFFLVKYVDRLSRIVRRVGVERDACFSYKRSN